MRRLKTSIRGGALGFAGALGAVLCGGPACYVGLTDADTAGLADGGDDGDGDGDGGDDDGQAAGDPDLPADFVPPPATMRRLTVRQYENSIADVFGPGVAPTVELEVDETTELFSSIGAAKVGTSEYGVEQYREAAFDIADQAFAAAVPHPLLADCVPQTSGDPCVRAAIEGLGLRLWRRPLKTDEIDRYAALVDATYEDGHDPVLGFRYAIAALVESPSFIYVPIVGEPAPGGVRRFTGWEMASRLSYLLWDSTPDDELLQAAASGELSTAAGVQTQARRMLDDERARDLLVRFLGEAWNVERLDILDKNPEAYPEWSEAILQDYRTEFRLVLEDLLARDRDVREIFEGKTSFASPALAELYGIAPGSAAEAGEEGFSPVDLGDDRFGLLTSGAVIAANSPSDRTSPTYRGVFLLERVLCQTPPPPPPNVDNVLPQDDGEGETVRDKLEKHRTDPVCAGCHALIDPLGLALEHFDGMGRYRDIDGDVPVDATGEFEGRDLDGAADVAALLAEDERAITCLTSHMLSFASGRPIGPDEDATLEALQTAFEDEGYRMRELVVAVVSSPAFRYLAETPTRRLADPS